MRVVTDDESLRRPDEAFVSYSAFLAGTKLSEDPATARSFLTNPSCRKVSSKRIRNYFESYIDNVAKVFGILSDRANSLIDQGNYDSKDALLDEIFDWEAIELRLGTVPGHHLIDGVHRGKEEIRDEEPSEIAPTLGHIARVLRRYKRKVNTELNVQITWRTFTENEAVSEIIEEENEASGGSQQMNPVIKHTLLAIFDWSGNSGTWQVAIGPNSGIMDSPELILDRISEEKGDSADIIFRDISSFS